jgi:membrane associated rhomboid family serine protease
MTDDDGRREPFRAPRREPFFGDVPVVVPALAGLIFVSSALMLVAPAAISNWIFSTFALWVGGDPPFPIDQRLGPYAPYALHVLVHGGWAHLLLNLAGLAAFGAATARRLASPWLFLAFFFLCSIAGAITEALLPRGDPTAVLGASSGVFGLVAGATYARYAQGGSLPSLFSRTMIVGLAPWVAINGVVALVGDFGLTGGGSIAWAAHYGGLAAGAALFPVMDRIARSQGRRR